MQLFLPCSALSCSTETALAIGCNPEEALSRSGSLSLCIVAHNFRTFDALLLYKAAAPEQAGTADQLCLSQQKCVVQPYVPALFLTFCPLVLAQTDIGVLLVIVQKTPVENAFVV